MLPLRPQGIKAISEWVSSIYVRMTQKYIHIAACFPAKSMCSRQLLSWQVRKPVSLNQSGFIMVALEEMWVFFFQNCEHGEPHPFQLINYDFMTSPTSDCHKKSHATYLQPRSDSIHIPGTELHSPRPIINNSKMNNHVFISRQQLELINHKTYNLWWRRVREHHHWVSFLSSAELTLTDELHRQLAYLSSCPDGQEQKRRTVRLGGLKVTNGWINSELLKISSAILPFLMVLILPSVPSLQSPPSPSSSRSLISCLAF